MVRAFLKAKEFPTCGMDAALSCGFTSDESHDDALILRDMFVESEGFQKPVLGVCAFCNRIGEIVRVRIQQH